jgi:hypothetical protein
LTPRKYVKEGYLNIKHKKQYFSRQLRTRLYKEGVVSAAIQHHILKYNIIFQIVVQHFGCETEVI